MLIEVKVPVLPESVAEATLVNWHKKAGEAVKRDENLIDIETDKVVLELPAPGSGVLAEVRKADGATVTAQEVIAVIDTEAKGAATAPSASPPSATPKAPPPVAPAPAAPQAPTDGGPTALPAARKILAEAGITAADVSGSGRGGRVTKADAQVAVEARTEVARPTPPSVAKAPPAPAVKLP